MSNISFGIGAKGKSLKKKQKAQTLAQFADPTEDHAAALDTLSDQQREAEADSLQVFFWLNDSHGVATIYEGPISCPPANKGDFLNP